MKNLKQKLFGVLFAAGLLAVTSCTSNNDDPAPQPEPVKTIATEVVALTTAAKPEFTILLEALKKTGLDAVVADPTQKLTVFAPTDAAFKAYLGNGTIATTDKAVLTELLKYHVLGSVVKAADIKAGGNYVTTLAFGAASAKMGLSLYVNNMGSDGIFLNGSSDLSPKVTGADAINVTNGVVHVINKVIDNSKLSVVNHAQNNSNFSTLVSLVVKADLAGALSAKGPFTVFAPSNTAFTALDTELKAGDLFPKGLEDPGLTVDLISSILQYHVVAGNTLKADVKTGDVQPLFADKKFTITKTATGSIEIKDSALRTTNVVATDIQGSNGVIHVLDRVLLPL